MSDHNAVRHASDRLASDGAVPAGRARSHAGSFDDTALAVEVRTLVGQGDLDGARDRFAGLVSLHQRRASRIAYQYLRNAADADEAVQDAFVKAFTHIESFRESWPFEVWLTRILVNGCLDRRRSNGRRSRWFTSADDAGANAETTTAFGGTMPLNPEERLVSRERRARLAAAVDRLDGRQRTVFMLCHFGDWTPREVGAMTGLNESTVRVHLFRAARKLRAFLGGQR